MEKAEMKKTPAEHRKLLRGTLSAITRGGFDQYGNVILQVASNVTRDLGEDMYRANASQRQALRVEFPELSTQAWNDLENVARTKDTETFYAKNPAAARAIATAAE
jgi:hypothetical protein